MTRSIRAVLFLLFSIDLNFRLIQRLFACFVLVLFQPAAAQAEGKISEIEKFVFGKCLQFVTIESSDALFLAKEIDASPFSLDAVLQTPYCEPRKIGANHKITMLQLTVEDPYSRLGHMELMYKYIVKKHKNEQIWFNAINATNTAGMTMLDYMHFVLGNGNFTSEEARAQVGKVRQFVCEHGGVYKKYPQRSCSDPSF